MSEFVSQILWVILIIIQVTAAIINWKLDKKIIERRDSIMSGAMQVHRDQLDELRGEVTQLWEFSQKFSDALVKIMEKIDANQTAIMDESI